jgi:hypothetical protein
MFKGVIADYMSIMNVSLMTAFIVGGHLYATRGKRSIRPSFDTTIAPALLLLWNAFLIWVVLTGGTIDLGAVLIVVYTTSAFVFVLIGEFMCMGLATWLTNKRGDLWTKEIDYVYLVLAAIGVGASANRLETVQGRIEGYDLLGPVIISIAIGIRLIKTRAEVAGWNKLVSAPTVPPAPAP